MKITCCNKLLCWNFELGVLVLMWAVPLWQSVLMQVRRSSLLNWTPLSLRKPTGQTSTNVRTRFQRTCIRLAFFFVLLPFLNNLLLDPSYCSCCTFPLRRVCVCFSCCDGSDVLQSPVVPFYKGAQTTEVYSLTVMGRAVCGLSVR